MDIVMNSSTDASTYECIKSSSTGLISSAFPEAKTPNLGECSQTGVSTRCEHKQTSHWYALRTTYGREKKAHDFINAHGGKAFLPTIVIEKVEKGGKKLIKVSRLPNIFFVYGTEEEVKSFVYDNYNLPYLRFYYKHTHVGARVDRIPMIVPDSQIKALMVICDVDASKNVLVLQEEVEKFKEGQRVQVIEGEFKGVEGIVARFRGQQRVGIVVEGLLTAVTAYIPSSFLIKL